MMNHEVRTYTLNGKILYTESFKTAEEAFNACLNIEREHAKLKLTYKKAKPIVVRRYNDGHLMTSTYVGLD